MIIYIFSTPCVFKISILHKILLRQYTWYIVLFSSVKKYNLSKVLARLSAFFPLKSVLY